MTKLIWFSTHETEEQAVAAFAVEEQTPADRAGRVTKPPRRG